MIQNILFALILGGTVFLALRYVRKVLSGRGSCCGESCAGCPVKEKIGRSETGGGRGNERRPVLQGPTRNTEQGVTDRFSLRHSDA